MKDVENLVVRTMLLVLNCTALYECWKTIDWEEVWWEGERNGMESWVWRGGQGSYTRFVLISP